MYKVVAFSVAIVSAICAEIPPQLSLQSTFKPDTVDSLQTHPIHKKQINPDFDHHPIYRGEERRFEGRARVEPVRPLGSTGKHDMLSDEPMPSGVTDVNRIDNSFGLTNPVEVAYPDIPYAPGYGYNAGYPLNNFDGYGQNAADYYLEPDTSTFGLLWSQVPDARTLVGFTGRLFSWVLSSMFILILGSFLTVGVCTYTNLCKITINGVGPIHEEMRALVTPERLEKISTAADFVKTAIDKYQKIQRLPEPGTRKRRAVFY